MPRIGRNQEVVSSFRCCWLGQCRGSGRAAARHSPTLLSPALLPPPPADPGRDPATLPLCASLSLYLSISERRAALRQVNSSPAVAQELVGPLVADLADVMVARYFGAHVSALEVHTSPTAAAAATTAATAASVAARSCLRCRCSSCCCCCCCIRWRCLLVVVEVVVAGLLLLLCCCCCFVGRTLAEVSTHLSSSPHTCGGP